MEVKKEDKEERGKWTGRKDWLYENYKDRRRKAKNKWWQSWARVV